ncbi:hypothetical protein PSACC_01178 [Paramicrosporidium saccamoebae]|uniref:Uncharacterized protein n=1 Tax=Paramicrosporidium saccamoebae TaxID=1246581 RepID=A0A2H9TML2_9FUNG|nr:hypothetical protein PSACC_01178 [Paramicrosporidium saccamoebae]
MVIRIVDLFCIGDVYKVMVVDGDRYRVLGETNSVKSDNCKTTTVDPDVAWEDGFWSRGEFVLDPGRHTIVLAAVSSPYGGGTFALRVDEEEGTEVYDDEEDDEDEEEEDDYDDESTEDVTVDDDEESIAKKNPSSSGKWTKARKVRYRTNARKVTSRSKPRRPARRTKPRKSTRRTKTRQSTSSRKAHTGITRRSTKNSRPVSRANVGIASIRGVCIGINGFVVIDKAVPATRMDAICGKYDWTAAQLSSSKNVKQAAIATLKECVEPQSTVWIGGYNQHDPKSFYGATLSSTGQVEINTWKPDTPFPVMCLIGDDHSSLE